LLKGKIMKRRKKKMKKAGCILLILVIVGGWAVKDSQAAQWCFELATGNYLKLSVVKPDPNYPFWSLNGIWYVPDSFIIPLVGTMVKSADGTERLLNLQGTLAGDTAMTATQQMEAVIDSVTKSGSVFIYYPIGGSNLEWSFTKRQCSTLPAP
jgi:hypothetical protein